MLEMTGHGGGPVRGVRQPLWCLTVHRVWGPVCPGSSGWNPDSTLPACPLSAGGESLLDPGRVLRGTRVCRWCGCPARLLSVRGVWGAGRGSGQTLCGSNIHPRPSVKRSFTGGTAHSPQVPSDGVNSSVWSVQSRAAITTVSLQHLPTFPRVHPSAVTPPPHPTPGSPQERGSGSRGLCI